MAFKNLIVILFLFCISYISAEPTQPDNTVNGHTSVLTVKKGDSHRPGKPSTNIILCTYENGGLVFDANFDYEYMDVEVSGPESILDVLTPTQPFIEAPTLQGTYTLRCTTDGSTVYEGIITL